MAIILESANGGITKTKLLTRANLTNGQLRQYLDVLITKKLVVQLADEEKRHLAYRTRKRHKIPINLFYSKKHRSLPTVRRLTTCCVIVPFVIDSAASTR